MKLAKRSGAFWENVDSSVEEGLEKLILLHFVKGLGEHSLMGYNCWLF